MRGPRDPCSDPPLVKPSPKVKPSPTVKPSSSVPSGSYRPDCVRPHGHAHPAQPLPRKPGPCGSVSRSAKDAFRGMTDDGAREKRRPRAEEEAECNRAANGVEREGFRVGRAREGRVSDRQAMLTMVATSDSRAPTRHGSANGLFEDRWGAANERSIHNNTSMIICIDMCDACDS